MERVMIHSSRRSFASLLSFSETYLGDGWPGARLNEPVCEFPTSTGLRRLAEFRVHASTLLHDLHRKIGLAQREFRRRTVDHMEGDSDRLRVAAVEQRIDDPESSCID